MIIISRPVIIPFEGTIITLVLSSSWESSFSSFRFELSIEFVGEGFHDPIDALGLAGKSKGVQKGPDGDPKLASPEDRRRRRHISVTIN